MPRCWLGRRIDVDGWGVGGALCFVDCGRIPMVLVLESCGGSNFASCMSRGKVFSRGIYDLSRDE